MRCSPIGVTPINSFALVTYMPEPLSSFLNGLRGELVSQCTIETHVTLLPPRPVPTDATLAWQQVSDHLRDLPSFEIGFGNVEMFPVTNVIYLSITTGRERLERLHHELNHTHLAYAEPFDYHPHLTLAQTLLPDQVEAAFDLARQRWADFPHARSFCVETLTFVQNTEKNQWVDLAELRLNGHRR